jgi:spore coat protein CotH
MKYKLLPIFLLFINFAFTQTPFPTNGHVFNDEVIPRVDVFLPADSLANILAPGNEQSNYHYHATFIFDDGTEADTLTNIGFRLRGNTSRTADKKSFKISFNTYEPGRKYKGLEKLNLNGEHNDPSIVRSKVGWDLARQMGIVATRANHVELYINGEYRGLYINVEHIDEEFVQHRFGNNDGNLYKCIYPADLDYKGANPDLYKEVFWGRRAYQLRTNTDEDDYADLAHFIDVLNNTSDADFACELEQVFNVQDYLKAMAFDILIGNWDGPLYNKNNFYLYHNQATNRFEYIPYDLDNTLGIDWLSRDWGTRNIYDWGKHGEPRPLYWRLIANEEYRALFTYYMDSFMTDIFSESNMNPYLDNLKNMLSESAENDVYRTYDYGFSFAEWEESFATELDYFQTPYGIKQYVTYRRLHAQTQLETVGISPLISKITDNNPSENEPVLILAEVEDDSQVENVQLCYQIGSQGVVNCFEMSDDGNHDDILANDGIYAFTILGLTAGEELFYYVTAEDDSQNESRQPRCNFVNLVVGNATVSVAINELMASNTTTIADEEGEFDDWLELYNYGNDPVFLGGKFLSDNENEPNKWALPELTIQPGEFLLFWADDDEEQGEMHTNFKLSAGGEFIGIFDAESENFALIDGINFGEQAEDAAFGRLPNGTGVFQDVTPTPAASNEPVTVSEVFDNQLVELTSFPNPFSNHLNINLKTMLNLPFKISIQDAIGRTVFEMAETINVDEWSVSTTNWAPGLYFVKLSQNGQTVLVDKVLLQK